eukprot:Skav201014  [mRNA]  locus=scaffold991:374645:375745:- [translate_table: standard]
MSKQPAEARKKLSTRRIWGAKGSTTAQALYEIATTPQRVNKTSEASTAQIDRKSKRHVDQETQELLQEMKKLSIQMKQDLEQLRSTGASSADQINNQQEAMTRQMQKLTEIAERHEDEIEDLRALQDFTHEIVFEREQKDSKLKMIIKSWPATASYYDRVRVTDWLLQQAQVQEHTKQEHGYYTASKRFTLSPVTVLSFADQDAQQRFEKYAYTSFSTKWPLHYWDAHGNRLNHWKGGWHKLVITKYQSKIDLIINMTLVTAMQILTAQQNTGYTGTTHLSHRTSDKHLFDLNARKVIAKATYDKDRGVIAIVAEERHVETLTSHWRDGWRTAHKDHPRYPTYSKFPYAITFAAARLDEEKEDREE